MMDEKVLGYGRYDNDPQHVGCPRAQSDMTPCIARDGARALADNDSCVGCGAYPLDLLVKLKHVIKLSPPSGGLNVPVAANRLRDLVRVATQPMVSEGER